MGIVIIQHNHYTTNYDTDLHYPILVHWIETKEELTPGSTSVERADDFKADPELQEVDQVWNSSEWDRGHNCPAKDSEDNKEDEDESFYYTNMAPQHPHLNRITWKALEEDTRALALEDKQVEVWCGSFGNQGLIESKFVIPTFCWKVIKFGNDIIQAYLMPNTADVNKKKYIQYLVTVDEVRKQSGLPLKEIA